MNDITQKLLEEVNLKLKQRPLLFVSQEAERGLGLEHLLEDFTIVSTQADYISEGLRGSGKAAVFSSADNTGKLPGDAEFITYLKTRTGTTKFGAMAPAANYYVQFFKNTSDSFISGLAEAGVNAQLLNNSASLTRSIENKVNQYQILLDSEAANYLPKSHITTLGALNIKEQVEAYGGIVLQLPFGHTGSSTYMIYTTDSGITENPELNELVNQYPNRACRVVEMIDGYPMTVNACVYRGKTYVGGLSYQYTGIAGLTTNPAATVGNDWTLPSQILTPEQTAEIIKLTEIAGELLRTKFNFKGLFGVDLVIDKSSGRVYLIEINPRQTASIPMHTKLQLEAGQVPLALLNLAEFLDIIIELDPATYSNSACASLPGSQVFLRSYLKDTSHIIGESMRNGVYRQQSDVTARAETDKSKLIFLDTEQDRPLIWQKDATSISDFDKEGILLLVKPSGHRIDYNEEVARIQAPFGLSIITKIGTYTTIRLKPIARDALRQVSSEVLQ